jgi:predicted O-methyltransferase YrrM
MLGIDLDLWRSVVSKLLRLVFSSFALLLALPADAASDLDRRIERVIQDQRDKWRDLNVPYKDGAFLRDFVIRNNFKRVVEIGTSTGHSGLWLGWGLTKTGGRLVTFEIDKRRHDTAKRLFAEARLADIIDARLESARTGIDRIEGEIDLVFFDGDHSQYRHYFSKLAPRLSAKGCFITRNVDHFFWDTIGYLALVRGTAGFNTKIFRPASRAIAVTCRSPKSG